VASRADPRWSRALLLSWLAAIFAISALRDLRALVAAALVACVLFWRGSGRNGARVARTVLPATIGLSLASFLWLRWVGKAWPAAEPFVALALRAIVIGFVTVSVLDRVALLAALAPFPTLSRLLVVTLAQIHALRMIATESREALRSRMPRRPGALDLIRGAGGITAALFTLSARNAREITEAMRSRGFE
jgi:cobalt/nickel transport system permease protein